MAKIVTALRARQNFGTLLNQAYYGGDTFVVERAGKEMAALLPIDKFRIWEEEVKKLSQIIKKAAERINLTEREALGLVQEAREKQSRKTQ